MRFWYITVYFLLISHEIPHNSSVWTRYGCLSWDPSIAEVLTFEFSVLCVVPRYVESPIRSMFISLFLETHRCLIECVNIKHNCGIDILSIVNITREWMPEDPADGKSTWWRHQMETFSALLALCAGNSPVSGEFPSKRPVARSFDVFFDLCLNKRLSK